jgi:outer membrane lipase/esterase
MLDFSRQTARYLAAIAASIFLVSCGGSENDTPAAPPLFQTTVVVGASATDTGNRCGVAANSLCFPAPPYAGHSTAADGPLFVQTLAARYGTPLTASSAGGFNYAIGGATTGVIPTDTTPQTINNMQIQLEQYLQRVGFQVNPQHLIVVDGSTFGNNIRRVLEMIGANPALAATLPTASVTQAATDIFNLVARFYAAGARHVLLVNSSNLGLHPAVVASGAQAIQLATGMSAGYNNALAGQVVPGLRAGSPGLNIYYVDFGALSNAIATNPANYGITNTTAPCYAFFTSAAAPICATPAQFMFWDELHPSAAVHAVAAQAAITAIGR